MKVMPSRAVAASQIRLPRTSARCTAASASTIVRLLMSSTKALTEVKGMLRISCGWGPAESRPRYTTYVAISDPKNMHSEPRNDQNSILRLFRPVLVRWCSSCVSTWAVATATVSSSRSGAGFEGPREQPHQHDDEARDADVPAEDHPGHEQGDPERRDRRPVRGRRHVDRPPHLVRGQRGLAALLVPQRIAAVD